MTRPARTEDPHVELGAMAVGSVLAALFLISVFGEKETRFEELALGEDTSVVYVREGDHPVHCNGVEDADACIEGFRARGASQAVLWLGDSQLHSVNRFREGQETAPPLLGRRLRPLGVDVVGFSAPAANLVDFLVLFSYLQERLPLRAVVVPLALQSLRRFRPGPWSRPALADPATVAILEPTELGRQVLAQPQGSSGGQLEALAGTFQMRSEAALSGWLDEHSRLWGVRAEARGTFRTWSRNLRNTVFRIETQSKRPLIEGSYRRNLAALALLLELARQEDVRVLVYITPVRHDLDHVPYVESEYARFKRDTSALAAENGAHFADLGEIIPGRFWGEIKTTLGGGVDADFMHFQTGGHALLAERVGDLLERDVLEISR